jgi:hypothetical protein
MPQYELDAARMPAATRKKLAAIPLEIVFDAAGGRVLARATKKLPRAEGVREVSGAEYEEALGSVRRDVPPAAARPRGLVGRLESSREWKLGETSPRKARLHWVAAGGDEQALGVELGEGRGDRIEIVRTLPGRVARRGVTLQVRPTLEAGEELGIGVVLTSSSERPWLERGPEPAEPNAWTTLAFDFSDVDERRLGRADQLMLVLHTHADRGFCLMRSLALLE